MYYNMRRTPDGYKIVKFSPDMEVQAVYSIIYRRGRFYCDCPVRSLECKHVKMINVFTSAKAVDTRKFYCLEEQKWYPNLVKED